MSRNENTGFVSMKQIAAFAGVSQSTVSIVINGQEKERHISEETVEKIRDAVIKLGYKPNLYARRLRNRKQKPIIAFFWPITRRSSILSPILNGLQSELKSQKYDCELVIQNYESDRLYKLSDIITKNNYTGIIVGASSVADLEFLESLNSFAPIVIFNRRSKKYSTVRVDNSKIASLAVSALQRNSADRVAFFIPANPYVAAEERINSFLELCEQARIHIDSSTIFHAEDSLAGGADAARRFLQLSDPPHFIFCESDQLALGVLHALYEAGKKVPETYKVLATGLMNPEIVEFSNPSLTTIDMQTTALASVMMECLLKQINNPSGKPMDRVLDVKMVYRKSFPENSK